MNPARPARIGFLFLALAPLTHAQNVAIFVLNLQTEPAASRTAYAPNLPLPAYPAELVRAAIDGYASLRLQVAPDGSVAHVEVTESSQREFADAASNAAKKWTFARLGGEPPPAGLRMTCTMVFRATEENYLPSFAAGFADTKLSGREVIRIASARAQKDGVDLGKFSGHRGADLVLRDNPYPLNWIVTWQSAAKAGEFYRVWINDATGEAKSERGQPAARK